MVVKIQSVDISVHALKDTPLDLMDTLAKMWMNAVCMAYVDHENIVRILLALILVSTLALMDSEGSHLEHLVKI